MSIRQLALFFAAVLTACGAEEEPVPSVDALDESSTSDAVDTVEDATDAVGADGTDADGPSPDMEAAGADTASDGADDELPVADAGDAGIGDACIEDVLPVHGAPCDCFRRRFYLEDETYCTVTVSCSLRGVDEATDTWYYHWQTNRDSTCGFPDQWGRDTDAID